MDRSHRKMEIAEDRGEDREVDDPAEVTIGEDDLVLPFVTTAFDKLARPIQRWIRSQGWRDLRDIQVRAITAIGDGTSDVIIAASTAGGKTEAAFLPLISQVITDEDGGNGFDLLYVAPLKALITDQANRLEAMCQEAELPVVPGTATSQPRLNHGQSSAARGSPDNTGIA
jgi:superfamily II DNA/RNA helicase